MQSQSTGKKIVTFGEIMLRLAPPGYERFLQSPSFIATWGGGEANVAVSVAGFGLPAAFVTVVPQNPIADSMIAEMRRFNVDTTHIIRGKGRVGIYFVEPGANQRPSKVVYDREYSSIALAKPGDLDWDNIFQGAAWFHKQASPRPSAPQPLTWRSNPSKPRRPKGSRCRVI